MRISNTIYLNGTITYPTSDGRSIQFILDDNYSFQYDFELSFHHRDRSEEVGHLPTDVLEHRIWVPDSNGQLWTTATRFTSELFVQHIYNFASASAPYYFEQMNKSSQQKFEENLILDDIRYGDDDRIYRKLLLGHDLVTVKFHYTVMTFDVAFVQDELCKSKGLPISSSLIVRLRENSLYDENYDPLPAIKFDIEPEILFNHNTALFNHKEEYWSDSQLPIPLVFEPTDEQFELHQSNVVVKG